MANYLFQPMKMSSQFNDADLRTVLVQEGGKDVAVRDGSFVVLGAYATDPVYTAAYTKAAGADTTVNDYNVRIATAPTDATGKGLCVVDLSIVPAVTNGVNTYRIGVRTVDFVADAGVPVRARILKDEDVMLVADGAFAAAVDTNKFATATENSVALTPASAKGTGNYFTIDGKVTVTEGFDADVTAYVITFHVA
nr:MAG TPA: hypothetical protein [Caudoviricetes sp.]